MATKLSNLSMALTVGSHEIFLQSKSVPAAAEGKDGMLRGITDAASGVAQQLKDMMLSLEFQMEKGEIIEVYLEDFLYMVKDKIGSTGFTELNGFFNTVAGATKGIKIALWDLKFSTKQIQKDVAADGTKPATTKKVGVLSFGFSVKVTLEKAFYTTIGVPTAITNIISLDSLGLGLDYSAEFDL